MAEEAQDRSAFGPTSLPVPKTDIDPRCRECNRMIARLLTRPWVIQCPRCKATNAGLMPDQEVGDLLRSKGIKRVQ